MSHNEKAIPSEGAWKMAVLQQASLIIKTLGVLLVIAVTRRWFHYWRRAPKVPAIGFWPIPYLGSWVAGIKFMMNPIDSVKAGIKQTNNGIFRVATLSEEFIVVSNKEQIAEYLRAPDSVLDMQSGANDQQQIQYTMGYGIAFRTYHNRVVKRDLTPKIPSFTTTMVDEITASFDKIIGKPKDFVPISFYNSIAICVARVSSRLFVGKDFVENKPYLQNATDYAQAVVLSAEVIRMFPEFMKSFVVKFLPVNKCMKRAVGYLGKTVQDRLDGTYGGDEKPEDLIEWLLESAPPVEKTVYQLVERVMALNVASIHTTTMTFTAAIYSLAMEPKKYMQVLRDEVEQNLEGGKITHNTVQKLVHIDSFLRESARMNVSGLAAMQRNAKRQFVFSDGTVIPVGAKLVAPTLILHRDPTIYEDPETFKGFRFVKKSDDVSETTKSIVTGGADFHLFGAGRHPCPGRFFAVHEMKIMFAMLVLKYDFKLAPNTKPKELYIATMAIPDTNLEVLFKERITDDDAR